MVLRSVPAPRLRLFTLGRLTLEAADGSAVVSSGSSKLLGLLAYLTTAPGRAASRERLIDLFWADRSVGNARASLRQLLSHTRSVLGRDSLEADELDRVALVAPIWTDREAFLEAIHRSDAEAAFEFYQGAFAPGLLSAGSAAFEHWADAERERLRELLVTFGEMEARQALARGDRRMAYRFAMQILEQEPTEQRAWRIRLEAESFLVPLGRRLASIAEMRHIFAKEGLPQEARTTQLLSVLEQASVDDPPPRDPLLQGELVGRTHQWEELHRAWREAQAGRAAHIHVSAGAGLGKSRLLRDFSIRLASERCRVILVRATPRQRELPYSVAADLTMQLSNSAGSAGVSEASAALLIDLAPAVSSRFAAVKAASTPDPGERLRARVEALLDLTTSVAHEMTLVLLLDDLHWWDAASRTMVSAIVERLRDVRVLTITAGRPMAAHFGGELLPLDPLDATAIEDFLVSIDASGQEVRLAELASRLAVATGGSPLLLTEALRLGLATGGIGTTNDGMDLSGAADFIHSLRPETVLADRIHRLPLVERQAMELAAILRGTIPASNLSEEKRGACLSLERRGLFSVSPEGWEVAHDAIGEAVLEALPNGRRRETHLAAASLLSAMGEHTLQARHLLAGDAVEEVVPVADAWVRTQRASGDSRPILVLLGELFGEADEALVRRIARRLSWSARRHPRTGIHLAWGLALASTALAAIAFTSIDSGTREVVEFEVTMLPRLGQPSTTRYLVSLPDQGVPLSSSTVRKVALAVPVSLQRHWPQFLTHGDVSSTGVSVFTLVDSGHNGPTSLVVVRDSILIRLADAPGDDVGQRWSPDGNHLVFETTRYPEGGGGFDLAILDYAEGTVTPLVVSPGLEMSPAWSADGARIAYFRRPMELSPEEICWVPARSGRPSCLPQEGVEIRSVDGWDGPGAIRFSGRVGSNSVNYRVDLATGLREYVAGPQGDLCRSAYGLRWTICIINREAPGTPSHRELRLFDTHHPETSLLLAEDPGGGNNLGMIVRWLHPDPAAVEQRLVSPDSVRVVEGLSTNVPILLTSTNGASWHPPSSTTTWAIADTSIVADSGGRLFGRRPGETTARALVGKQASPQITVTAVRPHSRVRRQEVWSDGWKSFWQVEGDPEPRPVGVGQMLIEGDDEYASGIDSKVAFNPERGIAVDAILSTRVDRSVWQYLKIGFTPGQNPSSDRPCGIRVPGGEGGAYRHTIGLGWDEMRVRVGPQLTTGERWRLRIQIFPDGSCGVAINDRPIFRSQALAIQDPVKISIYGQSVGTEMLVGPLTIWEGVPGEVDWNALSSSP